MRRLAVFGLLALAVLLEPLLFARGAGAIDLAAALPLVAFALALGVAYRSPSLRRGVAPAALLLLMLVLSSGSVGETVQGTTPQYRSVGHVPVPLWVGDQGVFLLSTLASLAGVAAACILLLRAQPPLRGARRVVLGVGGVAALSLVLANLGRAYNTFTPSWATGMEMVGLWGIAAAHVLIALALVAFAVSSRRGGGKSPSPESAAVP